MSISLYIAIGIIVIIIAYMVVQQIFNKRAVKELDQNEFHKGLRKAQVIDVGKKWIMIMDILMVHETFQSQFLNNVIKD